MKELLRDIENHTTPAQLDLLGRLWAAAPEKPSEWKPEWPERPKFKLESIKKILNTHWSSIRTFIENAQAFPIPEEAENLNKREKAEFDIFVKWTNKIIDIQSRREDIWRTHWVTKQLTEIQQSLKNDGDKD